jgi:spore coat polysaccharide biosynthesis protein SpsF (cytidylyltransferase family)
MKTIAIIQARMSSSRFPGKVIADLGGLPMVVFMAARVAQSKAIDEVILATSIEPSDDPLAEAAQSHGLTVFRGPLEDVLGRFVMVQAQTNAQVIVRMTGDCPLADPKVIDDLIALRTAENADYANNISPRSYPHGLDCEVFTAQALSLAQTNARDAYDREHVTPWMRSGTTALTTANLSQAVDQSKLRITVDHPEDLDVVRAALEATHKDATFTEIAAWLNDHPEITAINASHQQV